jgi:AhpC/TSA family
MVHGKPGRFGVVSLALFALLAAGSAVQARPAAQEPGAAPEHSPPPAPAKGDVVAPFDAQGVDGEAYHVDYPKGQTTILLFFLSGCPTCHKMLPEWGKMYQTRRSGSLRILGVLMDQEPPGFFTAMQIPFQVIRSPGRAFLQSYKIFRAPVTLRVGPGGKVEDAAVGLVDGIRLGELFRP